MGGREILCRGVFCWDLRDAMGRFGFGIAVCIYWCLYLLIGYYIYPFLTIYLSVFAITKILFYILPIYQY
jgi:hypothetical protein